MTKRCYSAKDICELLGMGRTQFHDYRKRGKLPFLEELKPRIGHPRYRADLVDRYLAGRGLALVEKRRA